MQNIGASASSLAERERQEMENLNRQQFSALSESLQPLLTRLNALLPGK